VLEHVLAAGYDPKYGARPMKRAVESEVTVPLARHLAARAAPEADHLELTMQQGVLQITPRRGG